MKKNTPKKLQKLFINFDFLQTEKFANQCNVPQNYLTYFAAGQRNIPVKHLPKVLTVLESFIQQAKQAMKSKELKTYIEARIKQIENNPAHLDELNQLQILLETL